MSTRLKKMELVEMAIKQLGEHGRLESVDVRNGHVVQVDIKLVMKKPPKK